MSSVIAEHPARKTTNRAANKTTFRRIGHFCKLVLI